VNKTRKPIPKEVLVENEQLPSRWIWGVGWKHIDTQVGKRANSEMYRARKVMYLALYWNMLFRSTKRRCCRLMEGPFQMALVKVLCSVDRY